MRARPVLPNVRVDLKNCGTGAILATTYTDAHGGYLFDSLQPGTYCVDVDETTLPAGMVQTPSNLPGADFGNQIGRTATRSSCPPMART